MIHFSRLISLFVLVASLSSSMYAMEAKQLSTLTDANLTALASSCPHLTALNLNLESPTEQLIRINAALANPSIPSDLSVTLNQEKTRVVALLEELEQANFDSESDDDDLYS